MGHAQSTYKARPPWPRQRSCSGGPPAIDPDGVTGIPASPDNEGGGRSPTRNSEQRAWEPNRA
jgi:hypothetical protein